MRILTDTASYRRLRRIEQADRSKLPVTVEDDGEITRFRRWRTCGRAQVGDGGVEHPRVSTSDLSQTIGCESDRDAARHGCLGHDPIVGERLSERSRLCAPGCEMMWR